MNQKGKDDTKMHMDPPLPCRHHRVHSTPPVIKRHHSTPSFGTLSLGNKNTNRSYACLTELNTHAKCIRRRRCTSCARLPAAFRTPIKMREWWGTFVDLSDVDDTIDDAKDRERNIAYAEMTMKATASPTKK